MKHLLGILCLAAAFHLEAQPLSPASVAAAQQEQARQAAEERYHTMASDIQTLSEQNRALEKRVAALSEELDKLREEVAKVAANDSVREDLKHLAAKIEEVDKKRQADAELINERLKKAIADLDSAVSEAAKSRRAARVETPEPVAPAGPAKPAWPYKIKDGDNLTLIIKSYNAELKEKYKNKNLKPITLRQVREANPGVNLDRLIVGTKILIPKPDGVE